METFGLDRIQGGWLSAILVSLLLVSPNRKYK